MNIRLIAIGKTDNKNLIQLYEEYTKRLKHYVNFHFEIIPDIKNVKKISHNEQMEKEADLILQKVSPSDYLILLDENGKDFTSVTFANYLQKKMNSGLKTITFVIGGPYGFSPRVYTASREKIALSKMTFSHQMVRLFFIEQLYRGFTILKNEPYHHR